MADCLNRSGWSNKQLLTVAFWVNLRDFSVSINCRFYAHTDNVGEKGETMFLKILKPVLRVFVRYAFQLELKGTQHAVGHEKTLIIANHESFLDALLLWLYLPVDATFVAH